MRRVLLSILLVVVVVGLYAARGPYFVPAKWMLGPCLMDWTSTLSWTDRASPQRTVRLDTPSGAVQVCYGAPSARGRTLFGNDGALVPFGRLWRMGANEPTLLFTNRPISLGDLELEAGRYSLYARPDSASWVVFANRSTFHWGNDFSQSVRKHEVGSTPAMAVISEVFTDTVSVELRETEIERALFELSWGLTRVQIPITWTN